MKPRTLQDLSAFTLVEIMVVVAILGLLATIAIANLFRTRASAQNSAFAASIRTYSQAFIAFSLEKKGYPADTTPGVLPTGMDGYIKPDQWKAETPIGGRWDWDKGQFGFKAGVSVYNPSADDEQMREIDRILDDGNLSGGSFRKRAGGFIFIIEP